MAGMNRLSPLVVRRAGPLAATARFESAPFEPEGSSDWLDDIRLFFTGWLGGLVFFGTFLA